jgi:hypothetical protein
LVRRTKDHFPGKLIEAVRDQRRLVDLKQANRVLAKDHYSKNYELPLA